MTYQESRRPFKSPVKAYGHTFPKGGNWVMVELSMFAKMAGLGLITPESRERGYLDRHEHFQNVVTMLWGPDNPFGVEFIWTPWAERMNESASITKYLAVAGCGNSGKSDFFAIWPIVSYLSAPEHTKAIVTSVSLKGSKERIFGRICTYWKALGPGFPGILHSDGLLKHPTMGDTRGITLIAGDPSKQAAAVGKLIGLKAERMVMVADELPELSPAILAAGTGNLPFGKQYYQMIGIGNPKSYYDPFGEFAQPVNGYESVHSEMEEWDTKIGRCIRFDGEKSPNILAGKTIYSFLPKQEDIEEQRRIHGENSANYFRMTRGWWFSGSTEEAPYSEADIIQNGAAKKAEWLKPPEKAVAVDPAFTTGGDRSVVYLGSVGESVLGKKILQFEKYEVLHDDVTNKSEPRNFQIARQFVEFCKKENVSPKNAVVDSTGGGAVFADIVASLWKNNDFLRCNFGGAPSDRPMSSTNKILAKDFCANRVTEIWVAAKELMRNEQIKGVGSDLAREITARLYTDTRKSGSNAKVCVESKKAMKSRIGKSPDLGDAAFLLVDLCRQRLGFVVQKEATPQGERPKSWRERFGRRDVLRGMRVNLAA